MSCIIYFVEAVFNLLAEHQQTAYNELKNKFMSCDWMNKCKSLEDVLIEFGFYVECDEDNNITTIEDVDMEYNCSTIIESIFATIAPFVQDRSYIQLYDDYGNHWRWVFREGKCIFVKATMTWEETEETAHECE